MLVQEVFSRKLRDRKVVARYAGLTGAPNESGEKRRATHSQEPQDGLSVSHDLLVVVVVVVADIFSFIF
jgi:hypothetical protein